ncbi:MAG: tetratricopeptide repeat protein [Spirochaetaceae bacterium]
MVLLLLLSSCGSGPGSEADLESYLRARALYIQGDLPGARRILEAPGRGIRHLAYGRLLLGKTLFFQSGPAAAAEELAVLVEENPHHVDAAKWLARSYLELSDPERAQRTLTAALEVSSEDPELLILMGRSAREVGNTTRAIEYLTKATSFAFRLAAGHLELAEIYRAAGMAEEAARHAQRAEALLGEAR